MCVGVYICVCVCVLMIVLYSCSKDRNYDGWDTLFLLSLVEIESRATGHAAQKESDRRS